MDRYTVERTRLVETVVAPARRRREADALFLDFGRAAFGTLRVRCPEEGAGALVVHLGERLDDAGRIDRSPPGRAGSDAVR